MKPGIQAQLRAQRGNGRVLHEVDGQVVVREMMNLSLSCDHRVIDGAVAADFARS